MNFGIDALRPENKIMRNAFFAFLHVLSVPAILRKLKVKNREVTVLMFHRIGNICDPLWPSISISSFASLMRELSLRACVIPLEKVDEIEIYPDKPLVALSFDDGYMDFFYNALPALAEFGLPAHHNICPSLIDKKIPPWTQIVNSFFQWNKGNKLVELPDGSVYRTGKAFSEKDFLYICNKLYNIDDTARHNWVNSLMKAMPPSIMPELMNWDEIRECARCGIHIGSHGMSHVNMSKIENNDTLHAEIIDSKARIYKEVGIEPAMFAFPNGLYSLLSMEMVKKAGYKIALLCGDQVTLFTDDMGKKNFFILPRVNICRDYWKEENLRFLGFHQRLKSYFRNKPYVRQEL